ncbi:uncharacterized protein LOC121195721 isoform X1 [Toxotes jaculatrix]|uniref:uncharacterized protein LOC121195721 isoform X1 n=1 Tax=Toxotes jaculatrix TaxID=941984 RepID=UPI001B3AFCCC|nr:uncharacterized protein LOC121195721 isoform X1 [Toxotes jaculatrix]
MKSWSMRVSRVLQVSTLLLVLFQVHHALPTDDASTSQEAGMVPVSQLRMLSLGLAHLLHGVEENAEQLEQQGEQVAADLDGATRSLESLHKRSLQTGRTHRQCAVLQVRKDLQMVSARGDRQWRVVKELQKGLEDLETEQKSMQCRMNRILQTVKSLTEPRSRGQSQLDISSIKVIMDKQAKRLSSLTSKVSAQDRLINRRLQRIEHLEKLLSQHRRSTQGRF